MLKDTKSLGNSKASACESRGFVHKKKKVRFLTHLLSFLPIRLHLLDLLVTFADGKPLACARPLSARQEGNGGRGIDLTTNHRKNDS